LIETTLLFVLSSKFIHLAYISLVENGLCHSVSILVGFGVLLWVVSLMHMLYVQVSFVALVILLFIAIAWHYVLDEIDKITFISAMGKWLPFLGNYKKG